MGQLLAAFAYASDLAFGLELEDGLRSCLLAARVAERLGLTSDDQVTVYYTSLLKDAGCTSWTTQLARVWHTDEVIARRELFLFTDRTTRAGIESWLERFIAPGNNTELRSGRMGSVSGISTGCSPPALALVMVET